MSTGLYNFELSEGNTDKDTLLINLSKKHVNATAAVFKFRDKDTRQIIVYIPSLDVSGYGATEEKAIEMLQFSIDQLFSFLTNLSRSKLTAELQKMGWKNTPYKTKEFSKQYFVNQEGELEKFNAVGDQVERLTLTTA